MIASLSVIACHILSSTLSLWELERWWPFWVLFETFGITLGVFEPGWLSQFWYELFLSLDFLFAFVEEIEGVGWSLIYHCRMLFLITRKLHIFVYICVEVKLILIILEIESTVITVPVDALHAALTFIHVAWFFLSKSRWLLIYKGWCVRYWLTTHVKFRFKIEVAKSLLLLAWLDQRWRISVLILKIWIFTFKGYIQSVIWIWIFLIFIIGLGYVVQYQSLFCV